MSYHYSAIPQFRELFDCPYVYELYAFEVRRTAQETGCFVDTQKTVDVEVKTFVFVIVACL